VAVFRCEAKIVQRVKAQSSTASAAYRAGERIEDRRTGLVFDYANRYGVMHSEIVAPEGAPTWVYDRAELWNRTEETDNRKDSRVAREMLLALPSELTHEQRLEVTRAYVREQFVDRGMVADIAMHEPGKEGDVRNYHAHVLLTMRPIDGDGFGPKERQWDKKQELEVWREKWADHQNRTFEKLGLAVRVDHRSLAAQGIDREPEPKLGPMVSAMERRGIETDRGDQRREVQARNAERDELHREYAAICRRLGIEPEQPREVDPLRVASRADPVRVRATAREKMAERLKQQAAEKAKDKRHDKEWREARAEVVTEQKKARETGKGSGDREVKPEAKKPPRRAQTKAEKRAAMEKRLQRQKEERHRDFGLEI
jgi:hypothetical protein